MTDVVKLGIMWIIGKSLWFVGASIWEMIGLSEVHRFWHYYQNRVPHSWMMIPVLIVLSYAMLMYKFGVYLPIKLTYIQGKLFWHFDEAPKTDDEKHGKIMQIGTDDTFYSDAFTNRAVRHQI